jgi:hypothetical protein
MRVKMNSGMLWFDNDPKTDLSMKIRKAADYYRQKYGTTPDLCLVNPSVLNEEMIEEGKIIVRTYPPVLPGHLWIGLSD